MHHLVEAIADFLSNLPLVGGGRKDKKAVRNKISELEYRPVCRIPGNKNTDQGPELKDPLPKAE